MQQRDFFLIREENDPFLQLSTEKHILCLKCDVYMTGKDSSKIEITQERTTLFRQR